MHVIIELNQKGWQKECINGNTELREKAKIILKKTALKLMNNSVFEKTMENARRHRDIRLSPSN